MQIKNCSIRDFRIIYMLSFFLLMFYFYFLPIMDFLINKETYLFVRISDYLFLKQLLGEFNLSLFMVMLAALSAVFFVIGFVVARWFYHFMVSRERKYFSALIGSTVVTTMIVLVLIQGYSLISGLYLLSVSNMISYSFLSYVMGVLYFGITATGSLKFWK